MGYMSKASVPRPPDLDINAFQLRSEKLDVNSKSITYALPHKLMIVSDFYETMIYFAQYGPMYRRVTACWKNKQESLIQVMGADEQMMYAYSLLLFLTDSDSPVTADLTDMFSTPQSWTHVYTLQSTIFSQGIWIPLRIFFHPRWML